MTDERLPVGVSSCLLGERVRWNGAHKLDPLLTGELARTLRFVPVCPEVEVGMGVPREPVHLVGAASPRMLGVDTGRDWTAAMRRFARGAAERLARAGVRGFVLKSGSPSCGLRDVPLHDADGVPRATGAGLFAAELRARLPGLPIVEERDLADPGARARFLAAVRAYRGVTGAG